MQVCHFQHLLRQFDKNEPGRFLGEGVSFRAKLIGVLEVPEARGDRMCQDALADLKMAIRAAGEHKQRIQVHVAIDGLRLRDDKTGDSLYHHPVHKISFIAQDMTDSRAFGYIFGSPDSGHRFFGIKTDKAASQVVIAMRDLFQVVFELKKKEIELAKQQLEGKSITSSLVRHATTTTDVKSKSFSRKHPLAYIVFYTPFDVGYKVAKFLPVKVVASAMKEIYRAKKVYDGVSHAGKLYPNAYLIMIIIGTPKMWSWTSDGSRLIVLEGPRERLSSILLGIHDPFVPFENLFCALFMGGIWDSLAKMLGKGQPKEESKDVKKTN
ncbi:hypothetical protein MSG28_008778 [Choristoneura fumiferana]|uniref:Uncharacterized protein n=1 Tax=Choristoneura fumiferana TaxID=7141 RepID=A0ACC0J810_CHOFU|nr:hypothetical protein MSG28_008778 [Choristoneura fumiferana]